MDTARTWVEVDLDALKSNLVALGRRVGMRVGVLAIVKANAYGHGAEKVAQTAQEGRIRGFGVTSCEEGLELRRAHVRAPIVILGPLCEEELEAALRNDLELTISSRESFGMLARATRRLTRAARVHLEVDTGMHRLGVSTKDALELLQALWRDPLMAPVGLMTHLAATDGALSHSAAEQLRSFAEVRQGARRRHLLSGVRCHVANSAALLSGAGPLFDMVRPGLALFGASPDRRLKTPDLRPVLAFRARIAHIQTVAEGGRVGYGGRWTAARASRVATVAFGYEDGVDRRLASGGSLLVGGRRVPIVGEISMDYVTADVTDVPAARPGDVATLIGTDGEAEIRVEEVARTIDTIPYEVLCSVGRRVRRLYRRRPHDGPPTAPKEPCIERFSPS